MINFLRTLITFIICYLAFTFIELAICMYLQYDPDIFRTSLVIILNMAPAGFLTDYLI